MLGSWKKNKFHEACRNQRRDKKFIFNDAENFYFTALIESQGMDDCNIQDTISLFITV